MSYHSSILTLTPSPCDHSRSAQAGGCRKRHPGVNFTDAGPSARAIGYPENHRTLMVAHIGETIYLLEKIYVINLPIFIYLWSNREETIYFISSNMSMFLRCMDRQIGQRVFNFDLYSYMTWSGGFGLEQKTLTSHGKRTWCAATIFVDWVHHPNNLLDAAMQHFNKHVDMSKKHGNYPKSNGISSGSSQFPKCFVTIFGYTDRCTIFF